MFFLLFSIKCKNYPPPHPQDNCFIFDFQLVVLQRLLEMSMKQSSISLFFFFTSKLPQSASLLGYCCLEQSSFTNDLCQIL